MKKLVYQWQSLAVKKDFDNKPVETLVISFVQAECCYMHGDMYFIRKCTALQLLHFYHSMCISWEHTDTCLIITNSASELIFPLSPLRLEMTVP